LCTAGKLYDGQSSIERISADDISLGKVQIDCIRCLKLYELNNETVNSKIGMEKVSWKAPDKKTPTRKKAPPVEQQYQQDYHDEVETSKRSSPLTYIVVGLILLAIALGGMMVQ
jgi:hypothetical protein